jgi:uncharacterized membrane protein (DUF106 family)
MYNQVVKNLEKEMKRRLSENQEEMLKMFFKQTLKPKPRFMPGWLWIWLASFFINLK